MSANRALQVSFYFKVDAIILVRMEALIIHHWEIGLVSHVKVHARRVPGFWQVNAFLVRHLTNINSQILQVPIVGRHAIQ